MLGCCLGQVISIEGVVSRVVALYTPPRNPGRTSAHFFFSHRWWRRKRTTPSFLLLLRNEGHAARKGRQPAGRPVAARASTNSIRAVGWLVGWSGDKRVERLHDAKNEPEEIVNGAEEERGRKALKSKCRPARAKRRKSAAEEEEEEEEEDAKSVRRRRRRRQTTWPLTLARARRRRRLHTQI